MSQPSNNERVFTWARFLTPVIVGIASSLLTAFGNWKVLEYKLDAFDQRLAKQEARVDTIESDRIRDAERYGEISAKLDSLSTTMNRVLDR